MTVPTTLRYTAHDEWVRQEGDLLVIGITHFAQDALGDIVHVELPEVGDTFAAGAAVAEVESTKATAEIYTPVSGEIVEINEALDGAEELVNQDPYAGGWMFKIRPSDSAGLDSLMDPAAYATKIGA